MVVTKKATAKPTGKSATKSATKPAVKKTTPQSVATKATELSVTGKSSPTCGSVFFTAMHVSK